jgi:hypothetical protein
VTELFENFHEICANIVKWAGTCPEATVSAWFLSLALTVTHVVIIVRRCILGRQEETPRVIEVSTPVTVPYVPNETILKLLRLLRDQDSDWKCDFLKGWSHDYISSINYGNLNFTQQNHNIIIKHKGVNVDLRKRSEAPDLDQVLLREAFHKRTQKELIKLKAKVDVSSQEAEAQANKELDSTLQAL